MKWFCQLLLVGMVFSGITGCAEGEENDLNTTIAPLSDAEAAALDACIKEIDDCRKGGGAPAECREIMTCLPDRERERSSERDWEAFCEGLKVRCADVSADDELCGGLMERCTESESAAAKTEGPPQTPAECLEKCLAAGHGAEICDPRCDF